MKVLWLVNVPLPEASILMEEESSPFGGWLVNASNELANKSNVELHITFPSEKYDDFKKIKGEKIFYYPFDPITTKEKNKIDNNKFFNNLLSTVKPDLVHIHGTEMVHTNSLLNSCKRLGIKTVISIQGLVSIIEKHMYSSLPVHVIYGKTIRDFLKFDNIAKMKINFRKRGVHELQALKNTEHIIGRTTWDKALSYQINQKATYHHCNETLRSEFYNHKWNLERCEKHSVFVSQGQYPIKGLHFMLEALSIVLREYPKTKLYISGEDIIKNKSIKNKLSRTYFGKYIKRLIREYGLENNVIFTGPLNEKKMCEQYLNSHVFVCPSSIENSPNSLAEAMLLGVPSVASFVGGIPDILEENEGFLYQHDAPYMLAHYIKNIFENDETALTFSSNSRASAQNTHSKEINTRKLLKIYNTILAKRV